MSITHSIVSALNLKTLHLHFSEDCVSSQSIRGVDSLSFPARFLMTLLLPVLSAGPPTPARLSSNMVRNPPSSPCLPFPAAPLISASKTTLPL